MKYSNLLYYFVKRSSCVSICAYCARARVCVSGCVLVLHVNGPIKEKLKLKTKTKSCHFYQFLNDWVLKEKKTRKVIAHWFHDLLKNEWNQWTNSTKTTTRKVNEIIIKCVAAYSFVFMTIIPCAFLLTLFIHNRKAINVTRNWRFYLFTIRVQAGRGEENQDQVGLKVIDRKQKIIILCR